MPNTTMKQELNERDEKSARNGPLFHIFRVFCIWHFTDNYYWFHSYTYVHTPNWKQWFRLFINFSCMSMKWNSIRFYFTLLALSSFIDIEFIRWNENQKQPQSVWFFITFVCRERLFAGNKANRVMNINNVSPVGYVDVSGI